MVSQFVTRAQYDILLIEAAGFMRCAYPMLRKEWNVNGVLITAVKKCHAQHISKLRQAMKTLGWEVSDSKWTN